MSGFRVIVLCLRSLLAVRRADRLLARADRLLTKAEHLKAEARRFTAEARTLQRARDGPG